MSPAAITARLRKVSQLARFCRALRPVRKKSEDAGSRVRDEAKG
jgi:hypothetical protein